MTCESFFYMEGLMTNYGITGKNVTSHILSYLDFDSMVAARMVSKTWYQFLEDERGLWISLMKKCFKTSRKKGVNLV
jgi:hypothetical protein